jgi:ubiquinone/menaquinone biosynthesis C-methylase UbiE
MTTSFKNLPFGPPTRMLIYIAHSLRDPLCMDTSRRDLHIKSPVSLGRFFDQHPMTADRILNRLGSKADHADLSEWDVANGQEESSTDQNHIGGTRFVDKLAALSGISRRTKVLDLGCGLGGSARYLAWKFGCHVDGIDISERRCADARRLSKLLKLDHLVTFRCADMMRMTVPRQKYDVVWGQGAWNHISDKPQFLRRWSRALGRKGRYAFEDTPLLRSPNSARDAQNLDRLCRIWKSYLISGESWQQILRSIGFTPVIQDLSAEFLVYCARQLSEMDNVRDLPANELLAYKCAIDLAKSHVVGYMRIVATMHSS